MTEIVQGGSLLTTLISTDLLCGWGSEFVHPITVDLHGGYGCDERHVEVRNARKYSSLHFMMRKSSRRKRQRKMQKRRRRSTRKNRSMDEGWDS